MTKKIVLTVLVISLLLCGCASSDRNASPPTGSDPKLSKMTDEELVYEIATNGIISEWMLSNHTSPDGHTAHLRTMSPEFNELMSRASGVETLKTYGARLIDEFNASGTDQGYSTASALRYLISTVADEA